MATLPATPGLRDQCSSSLVSNTKVMAQLDKVPMRSQVDENFATGIIAIMIKVWELQPKAWQGCG